MIKAMLYILALLFGFYIGQSNIIQLNPASCPGMGFVECLLK